MSGRIEVDFDDGYLHSSVNVAGEFTNWEQVPLGLDEGTKYAAIFYGAEPGQTYAYKYVVDGEWRLLGGRATVNDNVGNTNHSLVAQQSEPEGYSSPQRDIAGASTQGSSADPSAGGILGGVAAGSLAGGLAGGTLQNSTKDAQLQSSGVSKGAPHGTAPEVFEQVTGFEPEAFASPSGSNTAGFSQSGSSALPGSLDAQLQSPQGAFAGNTAQGGAFETVTGFDTERSARELSGVGAAGVGISAAQGRGQAAQSEPYELVGSDIPKNVEAVPGLDEIKESSLHSGGGSAPSRISEPYELTSSDLDKPIERPVEAASEDEYESAYEDSQMPGSLPFERNVKGAAAETEQSFSRDLPESSKPAAGAFFSGAGVTEADTSGLGDSTFDNSRYESANEFDEADVSGNVLVLGTTDSNILNTDKTYIPPSTSDRTLSQNTEGFDSYTYSKPQEAAHTQYDPEQELDAEAAQRAVASSRAQIGEYEKPVDPETRRATNEVYDALSAGEALPPHTEGTSSSSARNLDDAGERGSQTAHGKSQSLGGRPTSHYVVVHHDSPSSSTSARRHPQSKHQPIDVSTGFPVDSATSASGQQPRQQLGGVRRQESRRRSQLNAPPSPGSQSVDHRHAAVIAAAAKASAFAKQDVAAISNPPQHASVEQGVPQDYSPAPVSVPVRNAPGSFGAQTTSPGSGSAFQGFSQPSFRSSSSAHDSPSSSGYGAASGYASASGSPRVTQGSGEVSALSAEPQKPTSVNNAGLAVGSSVVGGTAVEGPGGSVSPASAPSVNTPSQPLSALGSGSAAHGTGLPSAAGDVHTLGASAIPDGAAGIPGTAAGAPSVSAVAEDGAKAPIGSNLSTQEQRAQSSLQRSKSTATKKESRISRFFKKLADK